VISKFANKLFGGEERHPNLFLTEDELKKLFEDHEEDRGTIFETDMTSNIFSLRLQVAGNIMEPIASAQLMPAHNTVGQLKKQRLIAPYAIIYHKDKGSITGVVYIKQLLKASDDKKLGACSVTPWFVSTNTPLIQILKQFKNNSENIAIVLDEKGKASGYLVFEDILDFIFASDSSTKTHMPKVIIDRTVHGSITLLELTQEVGLHLPGDPGQTLSEWLIQTQDHRPEAGDVISIDPYDIIIRKATFSEIQEVHILTQSE
jgi:CBS domain containing-hemolysin-like protein